MDPVVWTAGSGCWESKAWGFESHSENVFVFLFLWLFFFIFFNMTLLTVYTTGNGERERRGVTCSKGRPDQESNRRCHGNHAYVAVPMWYAPWPVGHQTPRDCVIESALEKVEKPEIAPTIWVDGSKLWDDNLGLFRPTLRPNLDRMLTTTEEPP